LWKAAIEENDFFLKKKTIGNKGAQRRIEGRM
jgi:hypothetical protein